MDWLADDTLRWFIAQRTFLAEDWRMLRGLELRYKGRIIEVELRP